MVICLRIRLSTAPDWALIGRYVQLKLCKQLKVFKYHGRREVLKVQGCAAMPMGANRDPCPLKKITVGKGLTT